MQYLFKITLCLIPQKLNIHGKTIIKLCVQYIWSLYVMLKEALVSLLVLVIILCKTLRCFPACTFFPRT